MTGKPAARPIGFHKRVVGLSTIGVTLVMFGLSGCAAPGVRLIESLATAGCPNCGLRIRPDSYSLPDPWSYGYTIWRPLVSDYPVCHQAAEQLEVIPPGAMEQGIPESPSPPYELEMSVPESPAATRDEGGAANGSDAGNAVDVDSPPSVLPVFPTIDSPAEQHPATGAVADWAQVRRLRKPPKPYLLSPGAR